MRIALRTTVTALALLLCVGAASAQGGAPYSWRALYQGQLAGEQVALDLTLGEDGFAYGRLTLAGFGRPLAGAGTHGEDGSFSLLLREALTAEPTSVAIDLAYHADQASANPPAAGPRPAARLTGTRNLEWTDDGATVQVELEHQDGASAPEGAGTLERVAQYAFGSVVEGRIDVSYAYPRFGSGAGALNELLERGASERLGMWLADGRDMVDGGEGLGWAWTHSESVDLMGAAGPYRSLLSSFYYYTGGAHPNGHGESMLLEVGEGTVRLLELTELFGPEAEWRAHLSGTVLASLAEQEAAAVLSGEITQLNEQDLATFTLGPAGLTFHFAPYAVGPYVQGSFRVTLAYEELMPLAAPGGALEAFAAKFGAD